MRLSIGWMIGVALGLGLAGTYLLAPPIQAQGNLTMEAVVLRNANLRAGPGLAHAVLGYARAGQIVTLTDYTTDWYQLVTGEWIAKNLVVATAASRVVAFRLEDLPVVANRAANLRQGPGTTFAIVGTAYRGQALAITGQNESGEWLHLQDGSWIAAFLVTPLVVGVPVGATISPVATAPPGLSTLIPTPTTTVVTLPITTAQPPPLPAQACDPYTGACTPPALPALTCAGQNTQFPGYECQFSPGQSR
ncbi:MAG: SH3 domain-containing protein [Caldilineaceae bacterium]|nr:SH3 domain-containing protein [Caldilineaceae bacterium]